MTRLRLQLVGILIVYYFGFLLLGAFAQPLLATPIYGPIPLSFLLGLILILGCVALTGIYAMAANRDDRS
jgi:uncharacterized membrane protein (DUF485 family)